MLTAADGIDELRGSRIVVEAIIEETEAKRNLFVALEDVVADDCVLASNTSSLSPTALAATLRRPERFVGLHFFNPVPQMRLVEVVPGLATAPAVAEWVGELAASWGKSVVRSAPTPGFIVNRVARPFYAEAWRVYEEGAADPATIDAVLTGAGGFRMGPFALMDLIGHDVNESVTRSVWAAFGFDARFSPSLAQHSLVEAGWLGRKSGRGLYDYADGAQPTKAVAFASTKAPIDVVEHGRSGLPGLLARTSATVLAGAKDNDVVELTSGTLLVRCTGRTASDLAVRLGAPVVVVDRCLDDATATAVAIAASSDCDAAGVDEAAGLLQSAGLEVYRIDDTPGLIVTRTVAMLVNIATDAVQQGVASPPDVDTAMRLGTNYPIGPLDWGQRWGADTVLDVLDELESFYRDGHYRACARLRRTATSRRQS